MRKRRERSISAKGRRPFLSLRGRREKPDSGFPPLMWVLVGLVALGGVAIVRAMIRHDRQAAYEHEMTHTTVPVHLTEWDPSWPALPPVDEAPVRPMAVARAAYAFAARKADVLQYVPCYCGCDQKKHRSNLDCYVSGGTAGGVPKWDPHAFT